MTIDELKTAYDAGEYNTKVPYPTKGHYSSDHIFDENLTVKENREMVQQKNLEYKAAVDAHRADQMRLNTKLHADAIAATAEYLEYDLGEDVAARVAIEVEKRAYNDHHSSMHDYFIYLYEYADFAVAIIDAYNDR